MSQRRDEIEATIASKEFHRDLSRRLMKAVLPLTVLAVVQTSVIGVLATRDWFRYFPVDRQGRLLQEMAPLDRVQHSEADIIVWASTHATRVFTFGFHDFQMRMQDVKPYFTDEGWTQFDAALTASKYRSIVVDGLEVLTSAPKAAGIVVERGVSGGRYYWIVRLPVLLTFQQGAVPHPQSVLMTMRVVQVPRTESEDALAFAQLITEPLSS